MSKVFEWLAEAAGWIQIVALPLIIGLIAGAFIYFPDRSVLTAVIAVLVILLFLVLGILLANRIWKKKGTVHFVSRVMATPELDTEGKPENL